MCPQCAAVHSDIRAPLSDIGKTTTKSVSHDVTTATDVTRFVSFHQREAVRSLTAVDRFDWSSSKRVLSNQRRCTATFKVYSSAHTAYLCVLCGSENKQRLFPYTTLNWLVFITETECLLRGTDWVFKCNLGDMLYMDLRTNIDYFSIQH